MKSTLKVNQKIIEGALIEYMQKRFGNASNARLRASPGRDAVDRLTGSYDIEAEIDIELQEAIAL